MEVINKYTNIKPSNNETLIYQMFDNLINGAHNIIGVPSNLNIFYLN